MFSHGPDVQFEILIVKNNVRETRFDMSQANRSQVTWVQPDVFELFLMSVGSCSANVGLCAIVFSWNVGPKTRCSRAEGFMLSSRYNYPSEAHFLADVLRLFRTTKKDLEDELVPR